MSDYSPATARNAFGSWQGQTLQPVYSVGPTISSLPPWPSDVSPAIAPPHYDTPPPSILTKLEQIKITDPNAKNKKNRLTQAVMQSTQPDYFGPVFSPDGTI